MSKLKIVGFARALFVIGLMMANVVNGFTQERPNIVFIFMDDLGWTDVGYMGSRYYETPNIDRLARKGMIFTQAYANAANCAPTRACLLTGQYSPRHQVYTVASSARGESVDRRLIPTENHRTVPLDKITVAESLKEAGYITAAIGKWHIGNKPQEQGFDFSIDRNQMNVKGHFRKDGAYLTDLLTDEAISFMERNNPNKTKKPFFLYLAHHAVHTPIQAKTEDIEKFESKEGSGCHRNGTYAAMIKSMDESVARVQHKLEALELSENTVLIFFSDNGGHGTYTCQKPLRGGKGMYYEGGIRVPMFAYWQGKIEAGTQCNVPVISTDFYPTFLELAHQRKPANHLLDGVSIAPLFEGKNEINRHAIYWHFPAYLEAYAGLKNASRDTTFRTRPVSVIRKGAWKLMMFHEEWVLDGGLDQMDSNHAIELYNLEEDPGEVKDLSQMETEKRQALLHDLMSWQKLINAPIPDVENSEYLNR